VADLPDLRETQPTERVHHFTVNLGMTTVLLIETTSWYLGLLQAALAGVALEARTDRQISCSSGGTEVNV
jgi:hypothetical protein